MTQEEKELLLKDLCARLPYGLKVQLIVDPECSGTSNPCDAWLSLELLQKYGNWSLYKPFIIKPYIRPMSSMIGSERITYEELSLYHEEFGEYVPTLETFDWLNANHFDYRGLIEKGLALEAPEGMYKTE